MTKVSQTRTNRLEQLAQGRGSGGDGCHFSVNSRLDSWVIVVMAGVTFLQASQMCGRVLHLVHAECGSSSLTSDPRCSRICRS